jgi:hypothetical protein
MAQTSGPSITARISLEGGEIVVKQLKDIGDAGAQAAKQVQQSFGGQIGQRLAEGFSAAREHVENFHRGLEPLTHRFHELHESAERFSRSVEDMGNRVFPHFREVLTLGLAAGAAGFVAVLKEAAFATHELENFANTVGLSKDAVLGLDLVAAKAGISLDRMRTVMANFARTASQSRIAINNLQAEAASGGATEKQIEELNRINNMRSQGIDVLRGGIRPLRDTSDGYRLLDINTAKYADTEQGQLELLRTVITRLNDSHYSMQRAAASQGIWQRGWKEMAPIVHAGTKEIDEAIKQLKQMGIAVSESEEQQSHHFLSSYEQMKLVGERFRTIIGNIVGEGVLPIFDGIRSALVDNLPFWKQWAERVRDTIRPIAEDIGNMIRFGEGARPKTEFGKNLLIAFHDIRAAAILTYTVLRTVFVGLSDALEPVAVALNTIFGTEFSGRSVLIGAVLLRMTGIITVMTAAFGLLRNAALFAGQALLFAFTRLPAFLGLPGLILAGFIALMVYVNQHAADWGEFGKFARSAIGIIGDALKWVQGLFFGFISWLTGDGVNSWETFGTAATKWLSRIGEMFKLLLDVAGAVGNKLLEMEDAFLKSHGVPEGLKRYFPSYGDQQAGTQKPEGQPGTAGATAVAEGGEPAVLRSGGEGREPTVEAGVSVLRGSPLSERYVKEGAVGLGPTGPSVSGGGIALYKDPLGGFGPENLITGERKSVQARLLDVTTENSKKTEENTEALKANTRAMGGKAGGGKPAGAPGSVPGVENVSPAAEAENTTQAYPYPNTPLPGGGTYAALPPIEPELNGLMDSIYTDFSNVLEPMSSALEDNTARTRNLTEALQQNTTATTTNTQEVSQSAPSTPPPSSTGDEDYGSPYAAGGIVPGLGSGDTVRAWLTPGEFVVNPRASRAFAPILQAINNFGDSAPGFFANMFGGDGHQHFAAGGLVMAEQGSGGRITIDLNMGGQSFPLMGDRAVANRMARFAKREQLRSGGTKPSWVS